MVQNIMENGAAGKLEDFILTWATVPECDYLYDLSGESFSGRYNLSALESASVNGKLYQLPLSSTLTAIFYNKTLFDEHGWLIPATRDDFYALCDEIEATGIRAFVPCFKYGTTLQRVGLGLSRPEVITSADKVLVMEDYAARKASCRDLLEHPMINGAPAMELYAVSGLKVEYAPWADADANVLSVTLADGAAIQEDKSYTVAPGESQKTGR